MEHLALGLVWLLGMLATVSPMFQQVHMKKMDMAPYSFDDQYKGCSDEMEKELKKLNRTEFVANSNYARAWNKAIRKLRCRGSQPSVLQPVHEIALMAYTLNYPPLNKEFNNAVQEAGYSHRQYMRKFPFKVLHFLLTKALHKLGVAQNRCYDVFRGVDGTFTAQPGKNVRFGYFASSSRKRECAEIYGKITIFSIHTCYGALISDYAKSRDHQEVLIPPFETFKVISVTDEENSRIIELQSMGEISTYNCEFVRGHSVTLAPLWGFILAATALATDVGI